MARSSNPKPAGLTARFLGTAVLVVAGVALSACTSPQYPDPPRYTRKNIPEKYWTSFNELCEKERKSVIHRRVEGVKVIAGRARNRKWPGKMNDEGCGFICEGALLNRAYDAYQTYADPTRYRFSKTGELLEIRFGDRWSKYSRRSHIQPDWPERMFKHQGLTGWGAHEFWLTYWGHPNCFKRLKDYDREKFLKTNGARVEKFGLDAPIMCIASKKIPEITAKYEVRSSVYLTSRKVFDLKALSTFHHRQIIERNSGEVLAEHKYFSQLLTGPGTSSHLRSKPIRWCWIPKETDFKTDEVLIPPATYKDGQ